MTPDEAIAAIQKLTEETIAELKRLNAEEQAIYDRALARLESMKIESLKKEIANGE